MHRSWGFAVVIMAILAIGVVQAQPNVPNNNRNCKNGIQDCYTAPFLCYDVYCLFQEDDNDVNKRHCEYVPLDCSDNNPCTINEQCNPDDGMCLAFPNPECDVEDSLCAECCAGNPAIFEEQIVVANRGDNLLTVLYADSEEQRNGVPPLELAFSHPMVPLAYGTIVQPQYARTILVNDRAHNNVRYLDARTYLQYDSVPVCQGPFHMAASVVLDQVWVVCDLDRGFSVLSLLAPITHEHYVPLPYDLIHDYTTHDVIVGADFAIVTMIGQPVNPMHQITDSWLIRYSTDTFQETGRFNVSGDAHVAHTGALNAPLYVAGERDGIWILDPLTFDVIDHQPLQGAHGLWITEDDSVLYVTNTTEGATGNGTLFAFDVSAQNLTFPLAGSPYDLPTRNPHHMVTTLARDKLFVTHTRDGRVSICDLVNGTGVVQQPCRTANITGGIYDMQPPSAPDEVPFSDHVVLAGYASPLGLTRNVPLCECEHACYDADECTIDGCYYMFEHDEEPPTLSQQCSHLPIPGCYEEPYQVFCPEHMVNISVVDESHFRLTPYWNGSVLEFCFDSAYNESVGTPNTVVLGFDEYQECALNLRGTCDNRAVYHDLIPSYCAYDAEVDNLFTVCFDDLSPVRAAVLPGIATQLNWTNVVMHTPTFQFDLLQGVAHLQGELSDLSGQLVMHLDLILSGAYMSALSPYTPMPPLCYVDESDPATWWFFAHADGRLYAKPGTAYTGLYLEITGHDVFTQFGYGASGRNINKGLYGAYEWVLVHQPFDNLYAVNATPPQGPLEVWSDLDMECQTPLDYCSLFEEPPMNLTGANNWTAIVLPEEGLLRYCRNFTLQELIACRSYHDHHSSLLNYDMIDSDTHLYTGRFYATQLVPEDCDLHVTRYYGACGEHVLSLAAFDFTIVWHTGGIVSASYVVADLDFDARWVQNIWLQSGDLKLVLETRVRHLERDPLLMPTTTRLINPVVIVEEETGFPLRFVPEEAECDNTINPTYCYQRWCLFTDDAAAYEIIDFSGYKPLFFDVEVKGHVVGGVRVNIDLSATHSGNPQYVEGGVSGHVDLYRDHYFTEPYDAHAGDWLIDCAMLYGRLWLEQHIHDEYTPPYYRPHIRKAYLCYSLSGDLTPYNPHEPYDSGCNSRPDAQHILVYSSDPYHQVPPDVQSFYQFHLLDDCDGHVFDEPSECFGWMVHALTPYKQLLQIRWQAHGDGEALIELFTEFALPVDDNDHHGDDQSTCDDSSGKYRVRCAEHGQYYDFDTHSCVSPPEPPHPPPVYHDDADGYDPIYDDYYAHHHERAYSASTIAILAAVLVITVLLLWYLCCRPPAHIHVLRRPRRPKRVVRTVTTTATLVHFNDTDGLDDGVQLSLDD